MEKDTQKTIKEPVRELNLVMSEEDYNKAVIISEDELKKMKEDITRKTAKEMLIWGIMIGMFIMAVCFAILSHSNK